MRIDVDIQENSSFPDFNGNERFYEKIFLESEIKFCLAKSNYKQSFCSRFCAKEAVIKLLDKSVTLLDIEIFNSPSGKPLIKIKGKIRKDINLSLSHTNNICVAIAVL